MKSENRLLLKKTPEKLESDPFLNPSGLVLTDQENEWLKQIIDEMYPRYHDAWQATAYRALDVQKKKLAEGDYEVAASSLSVPPPPDFPGQTTGLVISEGETRIIRINPGDDSELDRLSAEKESMKQYYSETIRAFFENPAPPQER